MDTVLEFYLHLNMSKKKSKKKKSEKKTDFSEYLTYSLRQCEEVIRRSKDRQEKARTHIDNMLFGFASLSVGFIIRYISDNELNEVSLMFSKFALWLMIISISVNVLSHYYSTKSNELNAKIIGIEIKQHYNQSTDQEDKSLPLLSDKKETYESRLKIANVTIGITAVIGMILFVYTFLYL